MGEILVKQIEEMLFEADIGGHKIKFDVPESMGGKGRSFDPTQGFVASLGACISAFVAKYCDNVDIDSKDMVVKISYDKEENPARLTNFEVILDVPNDMAKKKARAIEKAATHCPVHDTIKKFEGIKFVFKES